MPTTLNKQMLQAFRKDFTATVVPLQKKYGVLLALGSIRFDASQFSTRLTAVRTDGDSSSIVDPCLLMQKRALETEGCLYGGIQDCYGRVFSLGGKQYILVGIRPNSRKRPFCIQDVVTGKQFVLHATDALGNEYSKIFKASKLMYDFETKKVASISK